MYISIRYYNAYYPSLFGFEFDKVSNGVVFSIFLLLFWILSYLLMTRLKESDTQKDALLVKLQKSNMELEVVKNNMEKVNAMATHDLKTPIRNIKSMVGLIAKKNIDKDLNPVIDHIDSAATNMINLIDQTIEHDRMKNLPTEIVEIDLDKMLNHITSLIGDRFGEYKLEKNVFVPFKANEIGLTKVLQNLIENGVKYNKSDNKIVSVSQQLDDDSITIKVCDNGIGIDEEYRKKIFGLYTRLHSAAEFPGTGMGLAICRGAVEKMNGSIKVETNEKGGSSFLVKLPYAESSI